MREPKCQKCKDTGMCEERCDYPWGGYDMVWAFCDCDAGKEAERIQYEIYCGAPVAQGIEHRASTSNDAGSTPAGGNT